jgi:DNA polymerase
MIAGQRLPAGLGFSTVIADWDVETSSEAGFVWNDEQQKWDNLPGAGNKTKGLQTVGAAVYSEHPSTELLSLQFDLKDGAGKELWIPTMPLPQRLINYILAGGLLEAHNAPFEAWIARNVLTRYGFPPIPLNQFRCSMAKCRAHCLPPSLEMVGDVLNINAKKDKDGKRLLEKFSWPRKPTKHDPRRRIRCSEEPEDAQRLYIYNGRDIEAEAEVSSRVPDLSPLELEYWQLDFEINTRGVHVDRKGVEDCIAIIEQAHSLYNAELSALTGGVVSKASELAKLTGWMAGHKLFATSLDEENVDAWLERIAAAEADTIEGSRYLEFEDIWMITDLPAVKRALQIRQAVGSAAVKKVFAMRNQLTRADRLHDLFTFHGARTGRPTGNGPQPTNLPNSGPSVYLCASCQHWFVATRVCCARCGTPRKPDAKVQDWNAAAIDDALDAIATRSLEYVEMTWGDAMATVSACLRGLYATDDDHDHLGSDYSAIEAVVNAELSGEQWRREVFRTHGKIYEASASQMFKVPLEDMLAYPKLHDGNKHPLRHKGKVAELAFGYLGWIGAAKQFGMPGTDEEIKADILAWRAASPAIVHLGGGQFQGWGRDKVPCLYGLEGMAVASIQQPGKLFRVMRLNGTHSGLSFITHERVLYMILPDQTKIAYHNPRLQQPTESWRGLSIAFDGYNTNPKSGPYGWITMYTYAGKLLENACQAVANRILRFGQVNLTRAGYPIVLHVYDENVAEIPKGFGSIDEFERIMSIMPPWAADWPIKCAGGWRGKRYRK